MHVYNVIYHREDALPLKFPSGQDKAILLVVFICFEFFNKSEGKTLANISFQSPEFWAPIAPQSIY